MTIHVPAVTTAAITSVTEGSATADDDELSVEEPLQIDVSFSVHGRMVRRPLAVTMRTPGNDVELAAGFLFTEGLIRDGSECADIRLGTNNIVHATLHPDVRVDAARFDRHSFISSSCGVCGKRSIAAVFAVRRHAPRAGVPQIDREIIHELPRAQRAAQASFDRTGGMHAAALFDAKGTLLLVREDVGRHNALDKLIGHLARTGADVEDGFALLTSRCSYELVQKAGIARLPVLVTISAPTELAVSIAKETRLTLVALARPDAMLVFNDPFGMFA